MNPHRPRRPREDGAALRYLQRWRHFVELAERDSRERKSVDWRCPCCGADRYRYEARDRLESLMRNGGRRAHRLRVAVARLDERYREATAELPRWRVDSWSSTDERWFRSWEGPLQAEPWWNRRDNW